MYENLRQQIITGELLPGQVLIETALAEALGVSRTPIREALRMLQQDGLVERGPRGLRVRERSPAEILEIYEVRVVLESTAARAAAERYTEVDRVNLQSRLSAMKKVSLEDPQVLANLNRELHRAIWQASHNHTLVDLLERLHLHLFRYPTTTYTVAGRPAAALAEHIAMVEAIFERDAEEAASLARDHMTAARNTRLKMWEDHPESLTMPRT